jgi:hypothetical protein
VGQPAGGHAAGILSRPQAVGDRRLRWPRTRAWAAHQHHHADLLLRASGILPHDEAVAAIKKASTRPTARRASAWPTSTTAPST